MTDNIPVYGAHPGTIRVSGTTKPRGAGRCAMSLLARGVVPIDFISIGANASHQAAKAMGVFCYMVEHSEQYKTMEVAFQPLLFLTHTINPVSQEERDKHVTIWRTLVVERQKKN